jgi:hypothetical protein
MMTWMTRMSFFDTAADLKLNELALAFVEAESLFNEMIYGDAAEEVGPAPLPLTKMWYGYEPALAAYAITAGATLVAHGVGTGVRTVELARTVDGLRANGDPAELVMPPWLTDTDVLRSHRSNMMRRWPDRYSWSKTPPNMPYIWPFVDEDGGYTLNLSKHDKALLANHERALPPSILERIANR